MPDIRGHDTRGARREPARAAKGRQARPPRLEERTRSELYELAGELGIAGRSEMTRLELIEAIRRR
jgi:hypothetical protein